MIESRGTQEMNKKTLTNQPTNNSNNENNFEIWTEKMIFYGQHEVCADGGLDVYLYSSEYLRQEQ